MRKGIIYVYFNKAKYEKEGIEKFYVGQTVGTMEQRAKKDGSGYGWKDPSCNSKFARSIRKWGWDAFEGRVLEEVYEEDLDELEKFYIEYFDSFKNGYNSTLGGEGTRGYNVFANKTEEEMKETSKKMSKSQKKRFQDEKEREKCSKGQIKRFQDTKEREKRSIGQKKLWEDEEYKEKMSKTNKKRYEDPKERDKISGEKSCHAKSIYCKELNIIFSYIVLAEKYCKNVLNSKTSKINAACRGKVKSSGKLADGTKLTWKLVEDVDKEILNNAEYIDSKRYEEIIKAKLNGNKKIS